MFEICNLYPEERVLVKPQVGDKKYVLRFKDGVYTGETEDNRPHGRGIFNRDDGGSHEGMWKRGRPHGEGVVNYPNGEFYEGNFENGKRDGYGVYRTRLYEYKGNWSNGMMNG